MGWLKSDRWKAGLALAGMLLLLILTVGVPVSVAGAQERASGLAAPGTGMVQATSTVDATVTALNKEKLIQDVAQQQHTLGNWLWSNGAVLLSSLIVVIGALLGFLRWQGDRVEAERKEEEQGRTERKITADNQREAALQAYLDKMSELLLEKKLRESAEGDEVRNFARVRTLTVLRGLDAIRKASVLQFLHESGLVDKNKLIIDLNGADLSGAHLSEADLSEAFLIGADLSGADLSGADLSGAHLSGAHLSEADLSGAHLSRADLSEAFLSGANLSIAHLSGANLKDVTSITTKELERQAKSLKDATMPDGSIHC